jgi:DNA-binding response OmpR family regulator
VLDIHLPGLSGLELARRLCALGVTIPTIFITAHDEPGTRELAERFGAACYLAKPFAGRRLLAAIAEATREH